MDKDTKLLAQLTFGKILFVIVLIVATWTLLKWMRGFLNRIERHNPRLRFLIRQAEPPLRIVVWFGALLIAAQILAPSRDAFLAALTSAALAIGLGLQDLIKNLIGGLVIVTDRPYQTGDRVRVGEAYGEVVQIGLRSTKIRSPEGVLVTVPNSEALTRVTFNANAGVAECMASAEIALPRGADPDELMRIGYEVAISCPFTHLGREVEVELDDKGLGPYFMKLCIRAHVYDHRYESAMQTEIVRRAKREFLASGILKSDSGGQSSARQT